MAGGTELYVVVVATDKESIVTSVLDDEAFQVPIVAEELEAAVGVGGGLCRPVEDRCFTRIGENVFVGAGGAVVAGGDCDSGGVVVGATAHVNRVAGDCFRDSHRERSGSGKGARIAVSACWRDVDDASAAA